MKPRIKLFAEAAGLPALPDSPLDQKLSQFSDLIIKDCIAQITAESNRLMALSEQYEATNNTKRDNFELCATKCLDIAEMLKMVYLESISPSTTIT